MIMMIPAAPLPFTFTGSLSLGEWSPSHLGPGPLRHWPGPQCQDRRLRGSAEPGPEWHADTRLPVSRSRSDSDREMIVPGEGAGRGRRRGPSESGRMILRFGQLETIRRRRPGREFQACHAVTSFQV